MACFRLAATSGCMTASCFFFDWRACRTACTLVRIDAYAARNAGVPTDDWISSSTDEANDWRPASSGRTWPLDRRYSGWTTWSRKQLKRDTGSWLDIVAK